MIFYLNVVTAQCNSDGYAFASGEQAKYEVYYNWGLVWFNAAYATFSITLTDGNYKINSYGQTYENYDWIYKVRDSYSAIVDSAGFKPLSYTQNTREGKTLKSNRYQFNYQSNTVSTICQKNNASIKYDTVKIKPCTYDLLTAIYTCRNIPYKKLNINDTVPISVIIDNEIFPLYIRYLGNEIITNKDKRTFRCEKFNVLMVAGSIFLGDEDMTIWVTADDNKIPVYIEAKILVGSIKAFLVEIKGNKWPISSEISPE